MFAKSAESVESPRHCRRVSARAKPVHEIVSESRRAIAHDQEGRATVSESTWPGLVIMYTYKLPGGAVFLFGAVSSFWPEFLS